MRHLLLLLVLCASSRGASAQDRIILMNGEIINTHVLGQSTLEIRYQEFGKNGKVKERAEPTETVFSVIDSLGKERIWYFYDTVFGNSLSVDRMRWYINGERDARAGYKPILPMIGGFVFGAGASIAANLEVNSLFLPPLYSAVMILPRVHVTRGSITDPVMEGDEDYAWGYAKVGRSKRVVRCLLSTFAGVVVGVAVRQLVINPNLEGYD